MQECTLQYFIAYIFSNPYEIIENSEMQKVQRSEYICIFYIKMAIYVILISTLLLALCHYI